MQSILEREREREYLKPLDEGISDSPSEDGDTPKEVVLAWKVLGLVTDGDFSEVDTGELISDWNDEFSATRKSSNRMSVQKKIEEDGASEVQSLKLFLRLEVHLIVP